MLTANTPATLYNKYVNPLTRKEEWRRTELDAVHWENNKAANVKASGIASADSTEVMIWFSVGAGGKQYVEAKRYTALPPDEVDGYWTLAEMDDRLIKGIVPGDPIVESLKTFDRL